MKKTITYMLIIILSVILLGCSKRIENEGEENLIKNPRTDIDPLQKWFPDLQGIESAEWEAIVLGSNSEREITGPSSYQAKGIIVLNEDVASEYWNKYHWEEVVLEPDADYIDSSKYMELTWFYSKDMEGETKPPYFLGNFYFSGKYIWFDVTR